MVGIPVVFDQEKLCVRLPKVSLRSTADKIPATANQVTHRDNVITTQIFVIFSKTSNL